ncbi:hypothetical protein OG21DRAFT_1490269 [Imleria badia]|nr:hypothetical protein OG21DRAFT_1490269 [Imleria badia]
MNILQHMNQPNSSCYGRFLFSDFDNPTEGTVAAEFGVSHSHNMDQLPCAKEPDDEYVHRQSPGFDLQNDMEMDDIPLGHPNNLGIARVGPEQLRPERFVETFKGCGEIFPSGRTFMDQFREDQFAEQRRENIHLLPLGIEAREALPAGTTILGVVLSSDKTNISVMTGNHIMHPVLISLANIDARIRSKTSLHTYLLLALLPIAKFTHKTIHTAAVVGVMMSDPARLSLNSVVEPFWKGWLLSSPSDFITIKPLHHFHRFTWDHNVKWCIVVGIEGLTKHYIIGAVAGSVPWRFLMALHALLNFCYLAQALVFTTHLLEQLASSLQEFHENKDAIVQCGARDGWQIPKLELLQSMVPGIRQSGSAMQWTTDIMEHAHIKEIKVPTRAGNNQNYHSQIACHLNRLDKCFHFNLATYIEECCHGDQAVDEGFADDHEDNEEHEPDTEKLSFAEYSMPR